MIGAQRYFAARMWAPRYWMKVGSGGAGGIVIAIVQHFRQRVFR